MMEMRQSNNAPIYHYDILQGTEEWDAIRLGRITASKADTLIVKGKGENGFGAGAITYAKEIATQLISGQKRAHFTSKFTDWGHEHEPIAREIYEHMEFAKIQEVGFVSLGDRIGCSPDGLVGEKIGVEFKCPEKQDVFFDFVTEGKVEKKYLIQVQFNLWITGRERWDLCYYHPHFPPGRQFHKISYGPDKEMFGVFDERVKSFIELIDNKIQLYNSKFEVNV